MTSGAVRDILSRHGLRCTSQREIIYSALAASKVHPTAEELHGVVQRLSDDGGMSLATVYNTLDAFTRHGLARRIAPTRGGAAAAFRYDADLANHAHVVRSDGTMQDLPPDLSDRVMAHLPRELISEIEHRLGMTMTRVSVEFVQAPDGGGDRPALHSRSAE